MKKIMTWIIVIGLSLTALNTFAETYYDAYCKEYKPTAEETKALEVAQQVCTESGWEWRDVSIQDLGDYYSINTKCFQDGGNAIIEIDKKTSKTLKKFINPK